MLAAQDAKAIFAGLDLDKNGSLERREFPGSDEQFRAIDVDRNQKLSEAEIVKSAFGRTLLDAMRRNASAPRTRIDPAIGVLERLEVLGAFDANRDGRVSPKEWKGSTDAFAELDLDRDGDLDSRDRELAKKRAGDVGKPAALPELTRRLDSPERLLERLDRNRDGRLDAAEVREHDLAKAFGYADRNQDGALDPNEIARVVQDVARRIERRERGTGRILAYQVPFSTWDKDNDGRIVAAEWAGPGPLFLRIDRDRDAALTKAEIDRYVRSVEGRTFFERFDLDDNGQVTPKEYGGPIDLFRRLDRNRDGVITRSDG
jgi:Ca2+-binding EF-hand superfamily protein